MKEETIKIIEESRNKVGFNGTDFRFTILLKPKKDSLEIFEWEKRFGLTDIQAVQMTDKRIVEEMRMDAATEVFRKFYRDTYLK